MRFTCSVCGGEHDLDDISFGSDAPLQWGLLTDDERSRSLLGEDLCEIDSRNGRGYYIRACLEIPVRDSDSHFTWGVWCSLSEKSFLEIGTHWEDANRMRIGPHFGWLCTSIPGYPDSAFLKSMVHQRAIGLRPLVELEATDHPLAVHQRQGIEARRLKEMVMRLLHDQG